MGDNAAMNTFQRFPFRQGPNLAPPPPSYPLQTAPSMEPTKITVPLYRPILDVVLIILGWAPVFILNLAVDTFERGYYCDDESIRYPYMEDTISATTNYIVGAIIVLVVILIIEAVASRGRQSVVYVIKGKQISPFISSVYIHAGFCVIGVIMTQTVTDLCKIMVGRLRPNFLEVCNPPASECAQPNSYKYISKPNCQPILSLKILADSRVSFLSGHSSYAAYMMVFLALYIHARWPWRNFSVVVKHGIQFAFIVWALFIGMSRMRDYKHHWSDVLSGFGLGTLLACLTVMHFGKFFKRERPSCCAGVMPSDTEKREGL